MFIVNVPAAGIRLIVADKAMAREWMVFYASLGVSSICTPA